MSNSTDRDCLATVVDLVAEAASKVLEVYEHPFAVEHKADGSPLTEADMASHRILVAGLADVLADTPVISEESFEATGPAATSRFWLVDPLDGTREFVNRNGEFTVNVALVEDGAPRLGVVSAPVLGTVYGGIVGDGAVRTDRSGARVSIEVNRDVEDGIVVVGSRSHGDPELMERFLAGRNIKDFHSAGSSLKFCTVAEGRADIYPRFGRTMEWDTAAGHAVLLAAGGYVETLDGQPLRYGKPGLDNPHFVARSRWVPLG